MPFRRKQILFAESIDRVVHVEQQEKIFARFRKEKRLLAILQWLVVDVVNGRIAALGLCVQVQASQDVLAHVEVERVFGCLKQFEL